MARSLVYVANTSRAPAGASTLTLDDIPAEIKDEIEQVYKELKGAPDGRIRATFETVGELRTYIRLATAYCEIRPEGKLRFRRSPTRDLPETVMDFRVSDPLPEREATTEGIRDAVKAVKAAAPIVPAPIAAKASPATVAKKTTGRRR